MKKIRSIWWLFLWSLSAWSQQPIQLSYDFSAKGIPVSPMLYGIFFEDINYAADGGLYAELIRNRSFEESTTHWSLIQQNGSKGSMMLETQDLGILFVKLADSHGKIIRSWNTSPGMATFDTSELPDGIYSIQILSDGRVIGTQSLVLLK